MAVAIKEQIRVTYQSRIQFPLQEHRIQTVSKFKNRVDYVDISAYDLTTRGKAGPVYGT